MNEFLVADWHLGEDRFDIMVRPFTDPQEHVETLIKNHNSMVKPDDIVYHLGDVLYQKADPKIYMPQIHRFNGIKKLIRGNHDRPFSDAAFSEYFQEIVPEGGGLELFIDGLGCWLTHYPTQGRSDLFNLVGHIHAVWKVQLNMLNVSVDVHHFYPVPFERVGFYHKAICDFFDNDVWVGYNEMNTRYREARGKKSTYFQKG